LSRFLIHLSPPNGVINLSDFVMYKTTSPTEMNGFRLWFYSLINAAEA